MTDEQEAIAEGMIIRMKTKEKIKQTTDYKKYAVLFEINFVEMNAIVSSLITDFGLIELLPPNPTFN